MTDTQNIRNSQYTLLWSEHHRHILNAFEVMWRDGDLVDVTLWCEGRKICAHKTLLAACSPYFKDVFRENPCQHPVIIFQDVRYCDLTAIVEFIYQGEVSIVEDHLTSFMHTAKMLSIRGLIEESNEPQQMQSVQKQQQQLQQQIKQRLKQVEVELQQLVHDIQLVRQPQQSMQEVQDQTQEHTQEQTTQANNRLKTSTGAEVFQATSEHTNQDTSHTLQSSPKESSNPAPGTFVGSWKPKRFQCDLCWKSFTWQCTFSRHKNVHRGTTTCSICSRVLSTRCSLQRHMKQHS